jgi:hypothetical protein
MGNFKQTFAGYDAAILNVVGDEALLDGVLVQGKFDAPWLQPDIGTLRTGLREPSFTAPDFVIAAVAKGSVLTFDGKNYDVLKPEPDGTGMTILPLRPQ